MKTRSVALQCGLAAVGLALAYSTWQREPDHAPGEVVVLDLKKNDQPKIRYEDGDKFTELTMSEEAGEPVVWLHLSGKPEQKQPVREVRSSEQGVKLMEKFLPLRASRALGVLSKDKEKEFGFADAKKKLIIETRGQSHKFTVGKSPFNVGEPYVKDESDGKIYVLGNGILSDLDTANVRLLDRSWHPPAWNEYDQIKVTAGGKQRTLTTIPGANAFQTKLASAKTPAKADDLAKNWHDKVLRLSSTEVLGKGEKPVAGEPVISLKIEYSFKGKPVTWLEVGRVASVIGNQSGPPTGAEFYLRSKSTAGWNRTPTSDEILTEGAKVAGTE